jgi:6-phosphogluconate dehydrogenase (decarboxylating)
VVVCAIRLHEPYASHRTAARLPSQSSTAVTHCILFATNLPTPEGWTVWLTVPAADMVVNVIRMIPDSFKIEIRILLI